MGMSTHVKGVRDLDGQFAKMMQAKLACEAAGVGYPEEVTAYFRYPNESEEYLKQEMEEVDISDAITEGQGSASDIWTVELSKLPDGVRAVRFENSY